MSISNICDFLDSLLLVIFKFNSFVARECTPYNFYPLRPRDTLMAQHISIHILYALEMKVYSAVVSNNSL